MCTCCAFERGVHARPAANRQRGACAPPALPVDLPDWLPPWSNFTLRNASVAAACNPVMPPEAYINATLCGGAGNTSALLAASLGGGLSGVCGVPCVYNPAPAADDSAITAWLFDIDNSCW